MPRTASELGAAVRHALCRHAEHAGTEHRLELEHLLVDIAAEALLLEAECRRLDRLVWSTAHARVRLFDARTAATRRAELQDQLEELRGLAGELRARLGDIS